LRTSMRVLPVGLVLLSCAVVSGQALNETFRNCTAPSGPCDYSNNWRLAYNHSGTITYTPGNLRLQAPRATYPPGGGVLFLSRQIFTGDVDVSFELNHQGYGQTSVGLFDTAGLTQLVNFDLDTDDVPCLYLSVPGQPTQASCPSSQYMNRWLTLRIQLQGTSVLFYVDGRLMQTISYSTPAGSYRIAFGAGSVPWKSGGNDTSFRMVTGQSSLVFPIQSATPYETPLSSVTDHNRTPNIIVSYAAERGRQVDGVLPKQGTLNGLSGYHDGSTARPLFLVNGLYNDHFLFYEEAGAKGTYQHPGYDYPIHPGIVVAPIHGTLSVVAEDRINGNHGQNSAWCGFHTFKLLHDDGSHQSWFLHIHRFLNSGESGAVQNLDAMARAAVGPDAYDCKRGTNIKVDTPFATVEAGEALAFIGDQGVEPHFHLHHEERNGSVCKNDGSNCLIDPFGWEGSSGALDPLESNPGLLLWKGYMRPVISTAVINSQNLTLEITGTGLMQPSGPTTVEIWRKLDEALTGANPDDGTKLMSLPVLPGAAEDDVKTTVTQEIIHNLASYTVKVAIQNGPRSVAVIPLLQ